MDGLDPEVPPTPPTEPPPPAEPPVVGCAFAPLDYFKLKAALLEIAVQESVLREQAAGLQQKKVQLFAAAGLPIGAYVFKDDTFSVVAHDVS